MFDAIKVRLYPTPQQREVLAHQFGCVRWIYNWGLDLSQRTYRDTGKGLTYYKMQAMLPKLKQEHEWLKDGDSQAIQVALQNLAMAFDAFFKGRNRYPTFKSRHGKQSYTYPQRVKVAYRRDNGWGLLQLPKVGKVRAKIHREIIGKIKSVTISKDCAGRYWAAILVDDDVDLPTVITEGSAVGVDLGLTDHIVTSEGYKKPNPRFLRRSERNLKRKQKKLSRCKKGSNRRNKARKHVAHAHEKVRRARADFLHKQSRRLVNENQVICAEDLNVKGMTRNRRLAKSVADSGWSMFLNMLRYKCEREGKAFVQCHRFYPSTKTCNDCGHVVESLPLSVRSWSCPACEAKHDRDINAATNIRDEGLRILQAEGYPVSARGGRVSRSALAHAVLPHETGSPAP